MEILENKLHSNDLLSKLPLLAKGKRLYDSRLSRFLPRITHEPSHKSTYDDKHLCMCPFSKSIYKYSCATGHFERLIVPCGKCLYCRHKSQNKLIYRILNHNKIYNNCLFVTLTYNDEHYTDNPEFLRDDITKFLKRVRKDVRDNTFTYFMTCERGDLRNRCHFHLLIWWNGPLNKYRMADVIRSKWVSPVRNVKSFTELFTNIYNNNGILIWTETGFVDIDYSVTGKSNVAAYITKYVSESLKKLVFRSWSLGLGKDILAVDDDLLNKMRYFDIISYDNGEKIYSVPIPQYYKNKIFSVTERDVFFADYLISDNYKEKIRFFDSAEFKNLLDVYNAYEDRCIQAYKDRCTIKKKKKKLL